MPRRPRAPGEDQDRDMPMPSTPTPTVETETDLLTPNPESAATQRTQKTAPPRYESLMTPNEIAGILQISAETVKRAIRNGQLPAIKIGGRGGGVWRVKPRAFKRWALAGAPTNARTESEPKPSQEA